MWLKSKYKYLPFFWQSVPSSDFEKIKVVKPNLINSTLIVLFRVAVPLSAAFLISDMKGTFIVDIYFYSLAIAILLALFAIWKKLTINFIAILLFIFFAIANFTNLNLGVISIDRFCHILAYDFTICYLSFFAIRELFETAKFYFGSGFFFYNLQYTPQKQFLKRIGVGFFIFSMILTSVVSATVGYGLTLKKIGIAKTINQQNEQAHELKK